MIQKQDKNEIRVDRHKRIRRKIHGTAERPRFCVYRSLSNIYAQVIDDDKGNTIVSASTMDPAIKAQIAEMTKVQAAKIVGKACAERAKAKGIERVVFDRGGYLYTGRVAEVAAGAREGGLDF